MKWRLKIEEILILIPIQRFMKIINSKIEELIPKDLRNYDKKLMVSKDLIYGKKDYQF